MGITIGLSPSTPTPQAPQAQRAPRLTAQDVVERLLDLLGADPGENAYRQARRGLLDGYRELGSAHKWTYLQTNGRVQLHGSYGTGTVQYQVSSGTYPRQLTLTGGTWPAWAAQGYVRLQNIVAEVDQRVSDTVLTLKDPVDYQADYPAGTAYTLYQDSYTLPLDFQSGNQTLAEMIWGSMDYVPPQQWLSWVRFRESYGVPRWYTVMGDEDLPGYLALRLYPYPDTDATLDFVYQRSPRALRVLGYSQGTATVLLGSPTTVTFSGASLSPQMVGSVLRLGTSPSQAPTAAEGLYPAAYEGTITAVASTTSCTVDVPVSQGFSGVAYQVSDPLDIETTAMANALLRCAEKHLSVSREMKVMTALQNAYREALALACEADARVQQRRFAGLQGMSRPRLAFMPSGPDIS